MPDTPHSIFDIAVDFHKSGNCRQAEDLYKQIVKAEPSNHLAFYLLGCVLHDQSKYGEAILAYKQSLNLRPDIVEVYSNLGAALQAQGKSEDIEVVYESALQYEPDSVEILSGLGELHYSRGNLYAASLIYEKLLTIGKACPEVLTRLGTVYRKQGLIDQAIECYRKALKINPGLHTTHSSLLLTLHYKATYEPDIVYAEHRCWALQHTSKIAPILLHSNSPDPKRCLRIGYLSPDLRTHSVSYFFEPILKSHDTRAVEVFCYAEVSNPDQVTERLRTLSQHWRFTHGLSDADLVNQILCDQIDILVDLAGHTANNRLLVFAHKPAPIQVTYLGYPDTTGLPSVDYRLTDAVSDPCDCQPFQSEKLVRIEGGFLCFQFPEEPLNITPSPFIQNEFITFGSFNNLPKITCEAIAIWAQILLRVPGSRLLFKNHQLGDALVAEHYCQMFSHFGIERDRIILQGRITSRSDHLRAYSLVDIALDSFPYNGATTTCETLWMGVPVIVLSGSNHVGRVGTSLLRSVGLDEMIASSPEEYIEKAVQLALNQDRLGNLRLKIRQHIKNSPLCDHIGFTQKLESVYKSLWQQWCEKHDSRHALSTAYQYYKDGNIECAKVFYNSFLAQVGKRADVLQLLGHIESQAGLFACAADYFEQAINLDTHNIDLYCCAGNAWMECREYTRAANSYKRVVQIQPFQAAGHFNLALAFQQHCEYQEAIRAYETGLQLDENNAVALNNLGIIYYKLGHHDDAEFYYKESLKSNPSLHMTYNNFGVLLRDKGHLEEALLYYRQSLKLSPKSANTYENIATTILDTGRIHEAISNYRIAIDLKPDSPSSYSNLLFALHYDPELDPESLAAEHKLWSERYGKDKTHTSSYSNVVSANRRLRVGYYSPDMRAHSVAAFLEPILTAHSSQAVETYCYAEVLAPDSTTERLRKLSHHWHFTSGLSDAQMVELIRSDCIDILVDLAGHTARNRLVVFSQKPAPLQVSYLGYPNATGLPQIDYRISDLWSDPPGKLPTTEDTSERIIHLPNGFLCYKPVFDAPEVTSIPVLNAGYITFGSFNNLPKINERVVALWSQILRTIPTARLLLKSRQLQDKSTCERYSNLFAFHGINPERLSFVGMVPIQTQHLSMYSQVDIALDPFPYNGTTTTCEALWMGVPVITLAGNSHVSRVGVSLLSRLGLEELIADSADDYVEKAVQLAGNLEQLVMLRETLRPWMAMSPLCDAESFTRELEDAYRHMWHRWCRSQQQLDAADCK